MIPGLARRTPIGVDVGDDAIRMIQLDARSLKIRAAACLHREECFDRGRHELKNQMRKVLRRSGFSGSTCVVGAPRGIINIHPIRMPEMPSKELQESLSWEASERFDIPRESLQVDGIRTGARYSSNDGDRSEVVLFAMDDRLAEPWLEMILECGLAPLSLEPGFCSVARTHSSLYRRQQDRDRVHVIVDVGAKGTTMMFLRGERIGFCKTMPVGGDAFDLAMSSSLQVDLDEAARLRRDRRQALRSGRQLDAAVESGSIDSTKPLLHELASEVALCLRHCAVAFRGTRPEQIILSGRDAFEPGLGTMIADRCGIEVFQDDASRTISRIASELGPLATNVDDPSAWAAAMGLALRNQRVHSPQKSRRAA
jgi:type IV pilus assembly protein PilM